MGWRLRLANAVTLMRAPSNSRMLSLTWVAMKHVVRDVDPFVLRLGLENG
jgi:hypothetical protein